MMTSRLLTVAAMFLAMTAPGVATASSPKVPEIIGHRGESFDAPENTMASFNLGWERKDAALELDVHLSSDGKLVVSHDPDTKRITGVDLKIKQTPVEELRKLDAGKWKDPKYAGEKLPLLDEVLASIPDNARLFIEVKIGPEVVPELTACLKRAKKSAKQTPIIGFDLASVTAVKKAMPELKVYWLASFKQDKKSGKWTPAVDELISKAKAAKLDGIDVQAKPNVDEAFVKKAHDAGLEVYTWTVDDPTQAKALAAAGVEGITTNRAQWLREQLSQN